jgi:hemin uptake protein HemP
MQSFDVSARSGRIDGASQHGGCCMTLVSSSNDNRAQAEKSSSPEPRQIAMTALQLDSRDLFVEAREILIRHGNDTYRLRLTSQNKLILTK